MRIFKIAVVIVVFVIAMGAFLFGIGKLVESSMKHQENEIALEHGLPMPNPPVEVRDVEKP